MEPVPINRFKNGTDSDKPVLEPVYKTGLPALTKTRTFVIKVTFKTQINFLIRAVNFLLSFPESGKFSYFWFKIEIIYIIETHLS